MIARDKGRTLGACLVCDKRPERRVCADCDYAAFVVDCGHHAQPTEIAASTDGRPICQRCDDR